jgi:hypothetical protein
MLKQKSVGKRGKGRGKGRGSHPFPYLWGKK